MTAPTRAGALLAALLVVGCATTPPTTTPTRQMQDAADCARLADSLDTADPTLKALTIEACMAMRGWGPMP